MGLLVPALVTRDAGADVGPSATTTTTVPYRCTGVGFTAGLGTLDRSLAITFTAPTEVTVGQVFTVTADVAPIQLAYPGFPVNLVGRMQFNPVGATGSNGGAGVSAAFNVSSDVFNVPQLRETATPTVGAGGTITFTAGSLFLLVGSTGFDCAQVAGSTPATISTRVVTALTTTTAPTTSTTTSSTTTTAPTTSTSSTTSTTSTTTPSTPTPTVPPSSGAVFITPSKTESFSCDIYDTATGAKFNQSPLPPTNVTVTLTIPDKVGVGGRIDGLVKMDPGPMNGPIRLPAGTVNFAIELTVAGASPGSVRATGGPNDGRDRTEHGIEEPEHGLLGHDDRRRGRPGQVRRRAGRVARQLAGCGDHEVPAGWIGHD